MIHKNSDIQSKKIGNDTKIWQYCIVLPDAIIGKIAKFALIVL